MILEAWQFCDEDVLIFRTQIGERSAFDPLVTKYQPKIEALLMRQVHHRETAEDLTQETFVKAFSRINTFRGECAFYTWLYQIAQNVCIDYHRRQRARAKTFSSEAVDDTLIGTDTHPCPSQLMEQKELRAILGQAVLHLPPMRRRVFQLRFVEELPIKAIAKQINRSEGTVKTHISKAKAQLRELLTPYLQNENVPWLRC